MPLNWKDNFWVRPEKRRDFAKGDRAKVIELSYSELYDEEMQKTVGRIGVVEETEYNLKYGTIVYLRFKDEPTGWWYYLLQDLEKV